MASPGFTSYSVDPSKRFRKALDEAAKVSKDLKIPFALIADDFYKGQEALFRLTGPGRYPDLSNFYKRRKKATHGRIYPILKANGFLAVAASVSGGTGNITEIGAKELKLGVDSQAVPYAIDHQEGVPSRHLPMRKFMFFSEADTVRFGNAEQHGRVERWTQILGAYVVENAQKTGLAG